MRLQYQVHLHPSHRARVPSQGDEEWSVALTGANIKFSEDLTAQTMIWLTDGVSQESEDCGTAGLAIDIVLHSSRRKFRDIRDAIEF